MAITDLPELLTANEVAEIAKVHPSTVLRWANSGRLPVVHLGERSRRFRLSDVEKLLTPLDISPVEDEDVAS